MFHTCLANVKTTWKVLSDNVASCLVENWLRNTWFGRTERLPVSKCRVCLGDRGITDSNGLDIDLWKTRMQIVVTDNFCCQGWKVMALRERVQLEEQVITALLTA